MNLVERAGAATILVNQVAILTVLAGTTRVQDPEDQQQLLGLIGMALAHTETIIKKLGVEA